MNNLGIRDFFENSVVVFYKPRMKNLSSLFCIYIPEQLRFYNKINNQQFNRNNKMPVHKASIQVAAAHRILQWDLPGDLPQPMISGKTQSLLFLSLKIGRNKSLW